MNQQEKKTAEEKTETEHVADLELRSEQAEEVQAGRAGDPVTYTFTVNNTSSADGI